MSFSNLLQNAQNAQNAQKVKVATTTQTAASSASVMALGLDEPMVESFAEYPEEEWTLSSKYESTEGNTKGRRYFDDNYSIVDEKKNIKIDPSQINLTQETNSQYIPFIMPRYFDGIDIMNMTLLIYYINENKAEGWANPINVCYNDTHIKFGWLLTELETALKGNLTFEIHAKGYSPLGKKYLLKTKPNSQLEVLESLHGNGEIIYNATWAASFLDTAEEYKNDAEKASSLAGEYLEEIIQIVSTAESDLTGYSKGDVNELLEKKADKTVVEEIQNNVLDNTRNISSLIDYIGTIPEGVTSKNIVSYVQEVLLKYYTREEVDKLFEDFDISEQLTGIEERIGILETNFENFDGLAALNITYNESTTTLSFFNGEEKITDINLNISNILKPIEDDLANIHQNIDDLPNTLELDYYKKQRIDEMVETIESSISTNTNTIGSLSTTVEQLNKELELIDKSPKTKYRATYGDVVLDNGETAEYMFTLWKEENGEETVQDRFQILGGGGGSGNSISMKISYVEECPRNSVFTVNDSVIIKYNFEGVDTAGDSVGGTASWKIGNRVIFKEDIISGINQADLTDYVTIGDNKISVVIEHSSGARTDKEWNIKIVDVRIESTFNDTLAYPIRDISFAYTAYGAIDKTIHFVLDGEEIGTATTSASGIPMSYVLPVQEHGSHLLEVYITAMINDDEIESNHIFKDILWYDGITSPVIGTTLQNFTAKQYDTTLIKYMVYEPSTENPKVEIEVDDKVVLSSTLRQEDKTEDGYYVYPYQTDVIGEHDITIKCGDVVKNIKATIEKLDVEITPVTAGLEFDFNPIGYSNSSDDKLWSYNDVTMTVSDNFDWVNGGYQIDENGDQYFCVKAGTNAIVNYNLFADDPKGTGKEFKVVFRTKNIRKRNSSFLTCMDNNIGIDMKIEEATIYNTGSSLRSNYCEDTIIEYEFNINKDSDMMIVMTYEDGTPGKPCEYTATSSFKQPSPQPITIGSADCDVHIYRMKAYSTSLTDTDIKNNFIADARNATEMIKRYHRNQIYTSGNLISTTPNGDFKVEALMKAAPDLRYIFLEVPRFTTGKEDKVDDCTVYFRYPAGKRPHDNWTCTGMRHRGQGTSSEFYGPSGRNIDLVMDRDSSVFTWTDEKGNEQTSTTITLTDTSIPTDYLNIKVNIASSENTNNAQLVRRFNEFQPFLRYARKKDSRVKDTMEFYNCVVFIRETDDVSTHVEFNDKNWHKIA